MAQIIGIRDGHRYTITVTGRAGTATVARVHHRDCPCRTASVRPVGSARVARRRKPSRTA
ncbi:hypothetical protein ACFUN7_24270 [Streptomyces sp. NPDC057236]|uniref:hypothetical protein n=1 Tax=Streptomyces sp. NPDC057236 TaxID=3346059 RepID=UPI00363BA807